MIPYQSFIKYIKSKQNYGVLQTNYAITRLVLGVIYLVIFTITSKLFPLTYIISKEFQEQSFFWKVTLIAITFKIVLWKYIASWLISEGACVLSGVAYNEKTSEYDNCANVIVWEYETTPTFGGIIRSFNIRTNAFAAKYIFKRLKFLGSKAASQLLTLLFLATWHGLETGYFICFGMEFLIMKMETDLAAKIKVSPLLNTLNL